jgi:D-psicose/D-tagatose/L-ribulose 3-epimerase
VVKIGINTFMWTTRWENGVYKTLEKIKRLGFDAVQIPLLNLDSLNADELLKAIEQLKLDCFISAGLKDSTDVTSNDPQIRHNGIEYIMSCTDFAKKVRAPFLSGSFHSVFGKKSTKPVSEQLWKNSADCLRQVAKQINGYQLVLEPINRYESFLVNTAAQAEKLIEMISEPNIKIQLDTFHMGIEEDDFYDTIKSVKDKLVHFHVAENHRGRFGYGTMQWDEVFSALADIGYKGAIVIESFVPEVTEVATAAAIWRKMAPSADALASEGLEFIRKMTEKYNL